MKVEGGNHLHDEPALSLMKILRKEDSTTVVLLAISQLSDIVLGCREEINKTEMSNLTMKCMKNH